MLGINENPIRLQTLEERAAWVFENFRVAGYSATDKEEPGNVLFPYEPEWADLDKLIKKGLEKKGKFVLLHLGIRTGQFRNTAQQGEKSLETYAVRMCFSGSTHLTIARYAAQELMQYIQQGFGNVFFTPADLLFLQNHHENGTTLLLDHKYAHLSVVDGGEMRLLNGKEVVLYRHSQTFSDAALVCPEHKGFTDKDDTRLKKRLDEHLGNLQKAADTLKMFYDEFKFRVRIEY